MDRRQLLKFFSVFLAAAPVASLAAQCLKGKTPVQPEGPFYPIQDQLDKDTDLTQVRGKTATAEGEIVIVEGIVMDQNCRPAANVLVEIWQACATGRYNHPSDPNTAALDPNFQYWGKAVTDSYGHYKFKTIIPGAYPAGGDWIRPPHIHFKVSGLGFMELISQMYFAGEDLNQHDLILQRLKKSDQQKVIVEFKNVPSADYPVGQFDIQIERI